MAGLRQRLGHLAPYGVYFRIRILLNLVKGSLEDGGVERSAKGGVGGHCHNGHLPVLLCLKAVVAALEGTEDLGKGVVIGNHGRNGVLGLVQL